jgi:hypothetical protein
MPGDQDRCEQLIGFVQVAGVLNICANRRAMALFSSADMRFSFPTRCLDPSGLTLTHRNDATRPTPVRP